MRELATSLGHSDMSALPNPASLIVDISTQVSRRSRPRFLPSRASTPFFFTMFSILSLLYLANLALSIPLRALPGPFTYLPSTYARSQTATPPPSSSTALSYLSSGSKAPEGAGQSGSSSVPSSATVSRSPTPSSSPSPSASSASFSSPVSPQTQQDMDTVLQRRLGFITASTTQVSRISSWHVTNAFSSHVCVSP